MATNTKATEKEVKTAENKPAESIYSREELAKNHKVFDTGYAVVSAALRLAGKEKATLSEAKEIVNKFKNKEVK